MSFNPLPKCQLTIPQAKESNSKYVAQIVCNIYNYNTNKQTNTETNGNKETNTEKIEKHMQAKKILQEQ